MDVRFVELRVPLRPSENMSVLAPLLSDRYAPLRPSGGGLRQALVLTRRGQGLFKDRVREIERARRITGVDRVEHLRASHCKPWRDSTNEERLDGENGLLLTPNADHLFDRGFIGFEDNGDVLISPVAHSESLARLGIDPRSPRNVGRFSRAQQGYLEFHRENVLLRSRFIG